MWLYWRLFLVGIQLLGTPRRDLILENLVLKQQLAVCERRGHRPRLQSSDRQFWSLTSRRWSAWRAHLTLVQPATVVGWHRTAWRSYWRWKSRGRPPGRTRIDAETRALITRLARENALWGVRRIADELKTLGITVSSATVHRYRQKTRTPSPSWRTFFRLHAHQIWAVDFLTVQTLTFHTFYVFVVVSNGRRRIEHWNVTEHPTAVWVWRQVLEATPWGRQPRFLIRDRDSRFGANFNARLRRVGIVPIVTPFRAPKANAVVERAIGTLRRECLDHVLVFGETHLRHVLREYVAYYNATRPHQSLRAHPPDGPRPVARSPGPVSGRPILGGLHHEYRREAA